MVGLAWITAFLSGAGVLVVELSATRALAPYFGQALFVWTNVIGLVLLGLAVGSVLGGRLADRRPSPKLLAGLLLVAAALVALSAFLPPLVARKLLPEDLVLEAAYEFLLRGSFLTTLVCFVPPVVLLGAVPPFLVRCAADSVESIGSRAGQLYGSSTLGSIVGTFVTTYLLLPVFGTRGSLLLAAALLCLAAAPLWWLERRPGAAFGALLLSLLAAGASLHPVVKASVGGAAMGELLVARDSRYQHIEVRRRPSMEARVLVLDEGHDSYQSILPDRGYLTGAYYDYFNVLALEASGQRGLDGLILGLAGGTHARQMLHYWPQDRPLRLVGVEIDEAVVEMAREHLDLPADPRLEVVAGLDGRSYLQLCEEDFDLVIVDCFSRQSYLPFHLCTLEFFTEARTALRAGGYLAMNVFGYGAADTVVDRVVATLAQAFEHGAVVCALPHSNSFLLYARRGERAALPAELAESGIPDLEPLRRTLATPYRSWRVAPGTGEGLLRDLGGGLDRLQDLRLRDRSRRVLEEAASS